MTLGPPEALQLRQSLNAIHILERDFASRFRREMEKSDKLGRGPPSYEITNDRNAFTIKDGAAVGGGILLFGE